MGKLILILGGSRSGKSKYAVSLAKRYKSKVVFIATAIPKDTEMKRRIKLHKLYRPKHWELIEESNDINRVLSRLGAKIDVALIDCLGLWISNLLLEKLSDKAIEAKIGELLDTIEQVKFITILVSNEVGCGIVPDNPLARRFGDLLGLANQLIANKAKKVIFMQAGIPQIIKGGNTGAKIR